MTDWLLILLVVLQVLDAWSTWKVITTGRGVEGNPLLVPVMGAIGMAPTLSLKTVFVIACGVWIARENGLWAMAALDAFYIWVVVNNVRILRG